MDDFLGIFTLNERQIKDPKIRQIIELDQKLNRTLKSRFSSAITEFGFYPYLKRSQKGGDIVRGIDSTNCIFEFRSYLLKPGGLLEWEQKWKTSVKQRSNVSHLVGAWFSQIGSLNNVYHIWHYKDLAERKESRRLAWTNKTWSTSVYNTTKLIEKMDSLILKPIDFYDFKQ
ncbi:Protein NipSnap-like protein [Zancudomyces culisetae]|uniref:Protein NipSnap-like protein n=1 Tax=Zancudomyces culisetae TaxID=1213189 RepID=A0A1R1PCV2_ZANCU|nr:Protein NipSnap-like protein [Zancudomyces culisetae]|eukprot:OMH78800.1 Protein NipSnap-like protein [Zancudomyces culisetae]